MRPLCIQFSTCQPETWLGRHIGFPFDPSSSIRRATRSPYSHVDFILFDGCCLGASDSPDAPVVMGNPRGVAIRPPNYQAFGIRRRAYIDTPRADAIIQRATGQLNKPFDHGALKFRHMFSDSFGDRNWRDPGQWYCAELGMWCCEEEHLWPFELVIQKDRVTAADFLCYLNPIMDVGRFLNPVPGIELCEGETP